MECKYPEVTHGTAYQKGCRCEECLEFKRNSRKASAGRPFEERAPELRRKYPVPVAPILAVIEEWMSQVEGDPRYKDKNAIFTTSCTRIATPSQILAQELGMKETSVSRMLWRYRNKESTYMGFNMADKIISSLYGPHHWYENEELFAIYEENA